jgi:hypothetical protein
MQAVPEMRQAQLAALALPRVGFAVNADHGAGCKSVTAWHASTVHHSARHSNALHVHVRVTPLYLQHPSACKAVLLCAPRKFGLSGHLCPNHTVEVALVCVSCRSGYRWRSDSYTERCSTQRARIAGEPEIYMWSVQQGGLAEPRTSTCLSAHAGVC